MARLARADGRGSKRQVRLVSETSDEAREETAERYAQAAFELAQEAGALDAVDGDLKRFAEAMAQFPELREAALSPLVEPDEKARALAAVAERLGLSELGRKFIGVVAANRRAGQLAKIAAAYHARLARARGLKQVEVISAAPLSDARRAQLAAALREALGGDIETTERVDPRLLGGFIVRAGSRQFDASLRAKLDGLSLALRS